MKSIFISRSKILDLYTSSLRDISTHSLSEWLKCISDNQFIVIEQAFVVDVIAYIELNKYSDGFLGRDLKERQDLEMIKIYMIT